ncbi:hypothetical protein [Lactiplantibacillus plantarum]|uniref:hypothetical protein n=1 Tax=Lactiplantibacillus plantarum TaxID=1590 RepID=UPI000BAAEEC8|nr:hypothetical protein [Lactiplantibacillus plantarum]ASX21867.1 hypothetical protein BGV74_08745 [Lactiplantibacillus plantarum]WMY71862.1 hypothetical protein RF634_06600 [Lactiplantibacillus plantarum]
MEDKKEIIGIKKYGRVLLANEEEPGITLVLENGEDLKAEIKKAQQLSAELQNVLEHIKHFDPKFRLK